MTSEIRSMGAKYALKTWSSCCDQAADRILGMFKHKQRELHICNSNISLLTLLLAKKNCGAVGIITSWTASITCCHILVYVAYYCDTD